jgi:cytosine/adenosine deaminase-related metal-dependent hydrolase
LRHAPDLCRRHSYAPPPGRQWTHAFEFAPPPRKVLEWATTGGARALGLADRVGSLTPGKRADLILVRTTDINMAPLTEPVRMIVQSAQPSNIELVMVDGRILKQGNKLTTMTCPSWCKRSTRVSRACAQ